MADFDKLFKKMQSLEPVREEREYIKKAGKHTVKIVSSIEKTSQAGKDLVIIEYQVLESEAYAKGDGLKQIFALSNEQEWRVEQNLKLIQALIASAIPGVNVSKEVFVSSISGGTMSPLAGKNVTVVATEKLPQKDRLVSLSKEYAGYVVSEDVEDISSDDILLAAQSKLTLTNIPELMGKGIKKVRVLKPYISFSYRAAPSSIADSSPAPSDEMAESVDIIEDEDEPPFDI